MITLNSSEVLDQREVEVKALLESDLELVGLLPEPALRSSHAQREHARLVSLVERQQASVILAESAALVVRWLSWDSNHFGVPCADLFRLYTRPIGILDSLEVADIYNAAWAELQARGIRFVTARVRTDQHLALAELLKRDLSLVDTSVELGLKGPFVCSEQPPPGTRPGDAEDEAAIVRIVATFTDNRFFRDPRVGAERAAGVYSSWVRNALAAGELMVVEADQEVAGLATISTPDPWLQVSVIGLVVVDPRFRGMGVFDPLIGSCRQRADAAAAVVTSTQVTNARALRAFARCGLLPFGSRHVLHGWL